MTITRNFSVLAPGASAAGVLAVANGGTGIAVTLTNYVGGLTLSTAGSSATFGIAVGSATDTTNVSLMLLSSAYTKTTSAWAVGTAAGSLDTGAIANSTWYHVWLIQRPDTGVVDVLISTSATSPTLPTNYTLKRRIGSMKTNGSAQWTGFTQVGDLFTWSSYVAATLDINNVITGTQGAYAVTVPTGIKVIARVFGWGQTNDSNTTIYTVSSPENSSLTTTGGGSYPATCFIYSGVSVANVQCFTIDILTNTSAQINIVGAGVNGSSLVRASAYAWYDTRGKN
jgi:hypothetical protein